MDARYAKMSKKKHSISGDKQLNYISGRARSMKKNKRKGQRDQG